MFVDDLSKNRLKSLAAEQSLDIDENTEPFITAAGMFRDNTFTSILEVLTNAIESGTVHVLIIQLCTVHVLMNALKVLKPSRSFLHERWAFPSCIKQFRF